MSRDILENISALLAEGKLADLREQLCDMNVVDIAQAMESLPEDELLRIFRILPKDISADVFSYLEPDSQAQLLNLITDTELENLLDDMFLDDTVDFLEEVPANVVRRVLAKADSETRCLINRFLKYPENSAGSIMTIEMVELHDFFTVGQAIEHIRSTAVDKETVYTCFCIDDKRHLIGTVALHTLLMAKDNELIRDIMDTDSQLICVNTLDDQEKVADIARKYDLLSVPVVDNEARLVGIITIDDIVDVIEDENTEDFERQLALYQRILRDGLSVRKVEALAQEDRLSKNPQAKREVNPYVALGKELSLNSGLKIKIKNNKVVISFEDEDELRRIIERIS